MTGRTAVALALLSACALAEDPGLPVVSLGPLSAKLPLNGKPGATQAGLHRKVDAGLLRKGKWNRDGWRLALRSPGASGLRLHFTGADLRDGKLLVRAADGSTQTFKGTGPNGDGEFWTGLIEGDRVTVEWQTSRRRTSLPFRLPELSHLWVLP